MLFVLITVFHDDSDQKVTRLHVAEHLSSFGSDHYENLYVIFSWAAILLFYLFGVNKIDGVSQCVQCGDVPAEPFYRSVPTSCGQKRLLQI